ncbi:low density lipoprotein receptor adapter protein 1-like [Lytechinus variegatus]|uniref:low density lipoprotein receptor adapter protein 1-like n=1 Tax=Lytechinus variegatus TaxID=7654 RepID=UPI001BB2348B|nr:low density lipoprotein receptor adapter protein 1-like [Lytechinus variegatus]XP_041456926.1 low density lipoprotein receptor adapter protein 1-like [Lytechinus variegatus]
MASLFSKNRRKSASVELNEEPPEFELLFLGKSATERKMGRECTSGLIGDLVEQSRGKELKVVRMSITSRGVRVTEGSDPKKQRDTFIPIYSISYGSADKHYPRVFSLVTNFSKNDPNITQGRKSTMPFYCFAFVCQTPGIARAMVVYLLRSFKTAYEGWRRGVKSQRLRDKIKAGPGHNSFNPPRSGDEKSVADTMARLDELTGTNQNGSDKSSDTTPTEEKTVTPPDETATRSDKVVSWMDKWLGLGSSKTFKRLPSNDSSSSPSASEITAQENEAFAEREEEHQEFVDPSAMLNEEIDIVSELQDPEVQSVFEEIAESRAAQKAKLLDSL